MKNVIFVCVLLFYSFTKLANGKAGYQLMTTVAERNVSHSDFQKHLPSKEENKKTRS